MKSRQCTWPQAWREEWPESKKRDVGAQRVVVNIVRIGDAGRLMNEQQWPTFV